MYCVWLQIDIKDRNLNLQLDVSTESKHFGTSTPNEDHPPSHKKVTIERCFVPPMENIEKENTTLVAGNVQLNKVPQLNQFLYFSVCRVLLKCN